MHSRLCYETIPRSKSTLPGASDVVVELIGTQNRKNCSCYVEWKTVETWTAESCCNWWDSWQPRRHDFFSCQLSSQRQALNPTPSHQVQAFISWSAAGTQKLIKFWKEQCKHLQVQWSCDHGHGGECTACTKRTAQASKSHQIKRTVQISSGTIAIVMWEGGACMTKKYRHDIVYTVRIKEWDIWGIQYHIWGCRKNV